jgi:hypothetical protein
MDDLKSESVGDVMTRGLSPGRVLPPPYRYTATPSMTLIEFSHRGIDLDRNNVASCHSRMFAALETER